MSDSTGRNKRISSRGENLVSSPSRETDRNIVSKMIVPFRYCHSYLQKSTLDSNQKTIKNLLHRFGKFTILPTLENSLEQVKRNIISPRSHEELSKSIDKELLKLSIAFHPDRGGDIESMAALNAVRKVLQTLTEVFLENIFIDYKYEYFSRLDVRVLLNENNTIQAIFYKIKEFSEAKRMNIIGEIRKFLIESEKCVKSFFHYHESDFLKFRDYALYHLRKSIEGYKKVESEGNLLIEECINEDDSIRRVVQNMVDQSLRELSILRKLEQSAKSSFQGNFEIFPIHKGMEEYYILPFVDYVNVLSMCSLLLQPKRSGFFASILEVIFFASLTEVEICNIEDKRNHFLKAYILAYDINEYKKGNKKMRKNLSIHEFSQELRETLKDIFREVLQTDYTMDVYRKSNNSKTEILYLMPFLKHLEGKGKAFIEHLNQYILEKKEGSESVVNYRQDKKGSFEVDMTKEREIEEVKRINLLTEREKSKFKMERNDFPESAVNYTQKERKSSKADMKNGEKESQEDSRKLTSPWEGEENLCKMETKKFRELFLNCIRDEDESFEVDMINAEKRNEDSKKLTSTLEGEQNQNKMETKCCESVLNCRQDEKENFTVNMPMTENERERYSSKPNSLSEGQKIPEES